MRWALRWLGSPPRLPGLAPAGDLLSCAHKKVGKETAPTKPPLRGSLRCSNDEARAQLASLRSAQTVARSQKSMRAALAPRRPPLLGGFEGGASKQPTANSQAPKPFAPRYSSSPLEHAEERKVLRPRAQHASRTDSAQLFDRSVAKGVPHGPSRSEYRREPAAQRRAGGSGALSLPTFLCAQESRSPAGAKSRHGPWRQPIAATTP